jgi:hypothetical protein
VTDSEEMPVADRLQQLVVTRLIELGTGDRPMSPRAAALRSRGAVSYDTLYRIIRGQHSGQLRDHVAQGIANALELPVADVYAAAGVPRPQARWEPPERLDRLTPYRRKLLEDLGSALLEAEKEGYERGLRDARGE